MNRSIKSWPARAVASLEMMEQPPAMARFPLDPALNRCELAPAVTKGEWVAVGTVLATGTVSDLHASIPGFVEQVDEREIVLRRESTSTPFDFAIPASPTDMAAFARDMGLVGMGGSMFPASRKLQAAEHIHTLVVNAVECEPGIQIDEALLLHEPDTVRAGWACLVEKLGTKRTVLAAKRGSVSHVRPFSVSCKADLLLMPNGYPGGAEKLIVARLEGHMPPAGRLPMQLGYLVFSVASLWALGRRVLKGEPSIYRPLSLVAPPHMTRNILVPVGTPIHHLLDTCGVSYDSGSRLIVAGGLMMGRRTTPADPILKGTNAVFVRPIAKRLRKAEEPCILCGSCFDVCPLKLHPSGMADRIKARRYSSSLETQLEECFLCGACSAVCPAEIPLAHYFHEGKKWIRERT